MSLKMDNRDVAGNIPRLPFAARLGSRDCTSPVHPTFCHGPDTRTSRLSPRETYSNVACALLWSAETPDSGSPPNPRPWLRSAPGLPQRPGRRVGTAWAFPINCSRAGGIHSGQPGTSLLPLRSPLAWVLPCGKCAFPNCTGSARAVSHGYGFSSPCAPRMKCICPFTICFHTCWVPNAVLSLRVSAPGSKFCKELVLVT